MLFVPANQEAKLRKAVTLPCDSIIIDLEDSVVPARKAQARVDALRALHDLSSGSRERVVRINALSSPWGGDDLAALREADVTPDTVVIPKVSDPETVLEAARSFAGSPIGIIPTIETVRGLLAAAAIATCHPAVQGLFFGAGDFLVETGGQLTAQTLLYPRSMITVAAAAAGISAVDTPFSRLGDLVSLEADARTAAELGFAGKAVIHPEQIPVVNRVFTPPPERVTWAERVLATAASQTSGVWVVDGEMIDAMTVRLAQRVLAVVRGIQSEDVS
jgi:citrate lyase beta subunit